MTASPARRPGLSAPDPNAFTAAATPLASGAEIPLHAAATDGHLVGGEARTVAALGTAAVLALPDGLVDPRALSAVTSWLRAVDCDTGRLSDAPAVAAIGAFPFDPAAPATLIVPASTWHRDANGRAWRVDVWRRRSVRPGTPDHATRPTRPVAARSPAGPAPIERLSTVQLTEIPPGAGYAEAVARAVEDIAAGRLSKVVLSRTVEVSLPERPSLAALVDRLWGTDPAFRPYSVPVAGRRLVGASPELLVARRARRVASHAFAGTVALADGDEQAVDRLLASAKDRDEHRLVVEAIAEALRPRCTELQVPAAPSVVRLRSDARLGSLLQGTLRAADSALELLGLLHPTPAVGGVPADVALRRIAELEPPRGHWAGAVGWVDAAGDGDWVLAIRNAIVDGNRATVRAGAGIVAGSEPQTELAETTVKLSPVLEALWPGAATLL